MLEPLRGRILETQLFKFYKQEHPCPLPVWFLLAIIGLFTMANKFQMLPVLAAGMEWNYQSN